MIVAAVDIGTNTVRCLLADESGELDRSEHITGLGRGVDASGRLSDDAIARTVVALGSVAERTSEATQVRVVATSASRDAANRHSFFDEVEGVLGRRPELLSGPEEAALSFAGATADAPGMLSTVVDLGGGSTEVIRGRRSPDFVRSFDIGSVRITDRHLSVRPVSDHDLSAARDTVRSVVTDLPHPAGEAVGVGGTFQTLGSMLAGSNDGVTVALAELEALVQRLAQLTISETADVGGVTPGRETVILGGSLVAATVLSMLGSDTVRISRHDLLDGMVAQLLAQSSLE